MTHSTQKPTQTQTPTPSTKPAKNTKPHPNGTALREDASGQVWYIDGVGGYMNAPDVLQVEASDTGQTPVCPPGQTDADPQTYRCRNEAGDHRQIEHDEIGKTFSLAKGPKKTPKP